jgi:predicted HicB family RNase H-like nuclease
MKDNKNPYRMIHIRLTEELHKKLRIWAAEEDTTIQELVFRTLDKEVQKKK